MEANNIRCENCGFEGNRQYMERSCGNCFVCMACEIYICPECGEDITIVPYVERKRTYRQQPGEPE